MTPYGRILEQVDAQARQMLASRVDANQRNKFADEMQDILVRSLFDLVMPDELQSRLVLPTAAPEPVTAPNPAPATTAAPTFATSFDLFIELITLKEAGRESEAKAVFDKLENAACSGDFDAQLGVEICRLNGIYLSRDVNAAWDKIETRLAGICGNANAQFVCGMYLLSVYQKNRSPETLATAKDIMNGIAHSISSKVQLFWRDHQNLIH